MVLYIYLMMTLKLTLLNYRHKLQSDQSNFYTVKTNQLTFFCQLQSFIQKCSKVIFLNFDKTLMWDYCIKSENVVLTVTQLFVLSNQDCQPRYRDLHSWKFPQISCSVCWRHICLVDSKVTKDSSSNTVCLEIIISNPQLIGSKVDCLGFTTHWFGSER